MTVDSTGSPVLLLLVCHGHVDRLGVLRDVSDQVSTPVIYLRAIRPIRRGLTVVRLRSPDASVWKAVHGSVDDLGPDATYGATSVTNDHGAGTRDLTFTLAALSALRPGVVLQTVNVPVPEGGGKAVTTTTSMAEFTRKGCQRD